MNLKYLYLSINEIPNDLSFRKKIIWIISLLSKRSHYTFNSTEKMSYSKESAEKAAKAMSIKYPSNVYDYYMCPHCGKYHVGRRNF